MASTTGEVRIDGNNVICKIRVPYADTDQMQHVYYANYLVYFEIARNEWMRTKKLTYKKFEEMGLIIPVVEAHANYKGRVFYDDLIEVAANIEAVGRTRMRFNYEIRRVDEETLLVSGYSIHAVTTPEGKPVRIPENLRDMIDS